MGQSQSTLVSNPYGLKQASPENASSIHVSRTAPWVMLLVRTGLFASFQLIIAGAFAISGVTSPIHTAEGWWTFSVLFTNLVTIGFLVGLMRWEGKRYRDLIRISRETLSKDLILTLGIFVLAVPLSTLPSLWLAQWLFGSSEATFALMFRPLPLWAGLMSILMPVTIAFAELPTYFGYAMPRIGQQLRNGWIAWGIASFCLAFQHIAFPLIFDAPFMLWRVGMFLPFSFFLGLCLKLRPGLLPFLMVGHAALDLSLIAIILSLGTP